MIDFGVYFLVLIIVIWAMDAINLNAIFKKNRPYQARTIYIIFVFSLTYLSANFILEFLNSFK